MRALVSAACGRKRTIQARHSGCASVSSEGSARVLSPLYSLRGREECSGFASSTAAQTLRARRGGAAFIACGAGRASRAQANAPVLPSFPEKAFHPRRRELAPRDEGPRGVAADGVAVRVRVVRPARVLLVLLESCGRAVAGRVRWGCGVRGASERGQKLVECATRQSQWSSERALACIPPARRQWAWGGARWQQRQVERAG